MWYKGDPYKVPLFFCTHLFSEARVKILDETITSKSPFEINWLLVVCILLQMSVSISFLLSLLHFFSTTYLPPLEKCFYSKTWTTSHFLQLNPKFKRSCYDAYKMQIVLKQPVQSNFLSFILNLHFSFYKCCNIIYLPSPTS